MKLVIFGANGPTGQLLTKQALAKGHQVTAVTRHLEAFPIRHDCLQVLHGDVYDSASVECAVAGQDAVLSTLGVPFGFKPVKVYSEGMTNIMQAMNRYGIQRLVCVSSSATDPATRFHDTGGGFVFEKIMKPFFILVLGRTLYADMQRMEAMVMNSPLDWVIVRPSGLFETPVVTDYRMAEGFMSERFTSRADLASCVLRQVTDDQYLRKAVAVATVSTQPNMIKMLAKEAFGINL